MRTKDYTVIAKYNYEEKTKEDEQELQLLFDEIVKDLLCEYPHLLNNNESNTKTG